MTSKFGSVQLTSSLRREHTHNNIQSFRLISNSSKLGIGCIRVQPYKSQPLCRGHPKCANHLRGSSRASRYELGIRQTHGKTDTNFTGSNTVVTDGGRLVALVTSGRLITIPTGAVPISDTRCPLRIDFLTTSRAIRAAASMIQRQQPPRSYRDRYWRSDTGAGIDVERANKGALGRRPAAPKTSELLEETGDTGALEVTGRESSLSNWLLSELVRDLMRAGAKGLKIGSEKRRVRVVV